VNVIGGAATTCTSNPPNPLFPLSSTTAQLTWMVPTAKFEPDAGLQLPGVAPGSAGGVDQLTTAPDPDVASTVWLRE
jgi:hypothetical protein